MAHVDVAVCVGRAVVQNVLAIGAGGIEHGPVRVYLVPVLHHLGFHLDQIGTHGKLRGRKIQGFLVVTHWLFSLAQRS